jgi:peptidoglycan/xylan/chitin deacetylase (PgdA/CDA1 family)
MSRRILKSDRRSVLLGAGAASLALGTGMTSLVPSPARAQDAVGTQKIAPDFSYPAGPQAYRTHLAKRPVWPDNAKMVFNVQCHVDGPSGKTDRGPVTPLGPQGAGMYALRRGIGHALDMLKRQDIKATFMVPGYDALVLPEIFKRVHAEGHEITAHGYYHKRGDGSADMIQRSHDILSPLNGGPIVGWDGPGGGKDSTTIPTLRKLKYLYDATEKDDELPYFPIVDGKMVEDIVMIPNNSYSMDDAPQYGDGQGTEEEILCVWLQELEAVYETTGFYTIQIHMPAWGSGIPERQARVCEELIKHAKALQNVKFMRLRELAEYCLSTPRYWRMRPGHNSI